MSRRDPMQRANNIAWGCLFPILVLVLVIAASCQRGLG